VVQYKRDLAASYHNVGWLTHLSGRSEEAISYLTVARRLREELRDSQPENLDYQSELAGVLNDIGLAWYGLALKKHDAPLYATAEQLFRSAREHQRKASHEAPHVLRYRILLASHDFNLARLVAELGRGDDALPLIDEMLTAHPDDAEVVMRAARAMVMVADGTAVEADRERHLARAVKLAARAYLEMPNHPLVVGAPYKEMVRLKDRRDFKELLEKLAANRTTAPALTDSTASGPVPATPPRGPRP
jgi:tetratricopeptide (TPR) repeat protein